MFVIVWEEVVWVVFVCGVSGVFVEFNFDIWVYGYDFIFLFIGKEYVVYIGLVGIMNVVFFGDFLFGECFFVDI